MIWLRVIGYGEIRGEVTFVMREAEAKAFDGASGLWPTKLSKSILRASR